MTAGVPEASASTGAAEIERRSALTISGLSKSFGGAHALVDVSLDIKAGEVHGLLGENGSGKSTLIKVLAGYHTPEPGAIINVGDVHLAGAIDQSELRRLGVSFVHQDLGLIASLTVTDNFILMHQDELSPLRISWQRERQQVREALQSYGVDVNPDAVIEELSPLQQALVAVVRAVGRRGSEHALRLLILDEPTVFLPAKEVGMLFALMRQVAAEGAGVLFVTHDMGEVLAITDRVTVLRDGRLQGTVDTGSTTEHQLVELILGHTWANTHALEDRPDRRGDARVVDVADLSGAGLRDISLSVHEGEVLGVTGLVGSGFEQLPYLLLGGTRANAGRMEIGTWSVELRDLRSTAAVAAGIALVPGNRLADGVVADMTLAPRPSRPVADQPAQRAAGAASGDHGGSRPRMRRSLGSELRRPGRPRAPAWPAGDGGRAPGHRDGWPLQPIRQGRRRPDRGASSRPRADRGRSNCDQGDGHRRHLHPGQPRSEPAHVRGDDRCRRGSAPARPVGRSACAHLSRHPDCA